MIFFKAIGPVNVINIKVNEAKMQNLTIELIILAETNCDHQNDISEENTALPIFETWV